MHQPVPRVLGRAAAVVLLSAAVTAIAAQTPPPKPPQPDPQRPTFRTEANFVRVDVYPTSNGKALTDLSREDFEVLEDGRPQTLVTFEHVRVATGAQPVRADPNTVEEMRQAAANPRSRIFVIFLDAPHVTADGARNVGAALIRFIDRALGPDDLVGVMTPWMAPSDIVLARKTQVIEAGLRDASWGRRFTVDEDVKESMYKMCYRVLQQELEQGKTVSDLARILLLRRREVLTLEALRDLVVYLRDVREERKAILAVTEGWTLYRPDAEIMRLREECTCPPGMRRRDLQDCTGCKPYPPGAPWKEEVPGREPIRVGPDGRIRMGGIDSSAGMLSSTECNADRMRLASINHEQFVRDLVDDANRANATFYTIDPRGLAVFDMPIYRDADEIGLPQNVAVDQQSLRRRHDAMANLASGTDGIAVLNSNDLAGGLQRISEDLSSYYLLGYYSTNAKLDGRFRAITVRVKRPGVDVRARRGYRAPTEAEVAAARMSTTSASGVAEPISGIAAALASLARIRPDARFRMHAAPARNANGSVAVWIAGELPPAMQGWAQGGTVALEITGAGASATSQVTLRPGERAFLTSMPVGGTAAAIDVRGRLTNPDATVTPFTETIRVDVSSAAPPQALIYRRGPATGNRLQPAADFQFGRSERARVELPIGADAKPTSGRLLDKGGVEIKVPVAVSERTDAAGQRWLIADITLAPLGPGDYVVELAAATPGGEQKTLTAIRVTR